MTVPRNWWNVQNIEQSKQMEAITLFNKDVYNILNKGFIPSENMRGTLLNVTFSGLNTNTQAQHGLDFVPLNYWVVGLSADIRVYDGSISNDKIFVNFRCAGTTGSARIFVF